MNNKILIKKLSGNIEDELKSINFSADYIKTAEKKFLPQTIKIFNLKPAEANILKQSCLSLGFDAAVHRDTITCRCEKSDAILCGSTSQFLKLCENLKKQPFRLKTLSEELQKYLLPKQNYFINGHEFDFSKTYLMGILNVTPDSFSDGGKNYDTETAVNSALQMYKDGAAILDIGGESTRPDAVPVDVQTECNRILPVIEKIKKSNKDILISVDTIHPETIVKAVEAGADILNTVADIKIFESVFDFLKKHKTPIVVTHSDGIPPKPVLKDFDGDIADNLFRYFAEKIDYLKENGLTENLFILDVGIGFGKSINDQFELIKRAGEFLSLGYPVLYGISRKSFISKTFGTESRDKVSQIYAHHLMMNKINMLRVHDVKAHANLQIYLSKIM
ncbi:MAG: dihydropteroate synthase [Candidatus Gastranaerophilales bacterium]|nr:dihydropteroate synthase [Candidatus Gastranaerophilales bacterium]